MQEITKINEPIWTIEDVKSSLEEFSELYKQRPIANNKGGMKSPHLLASWLAIKQIQPKYIIESGVWWGQGTCFFEKAAPEAKLICIDPNPFRIKYKSKNAQYLTRDFKAIDWSDLPKDSTLVFFDDHQNAVERLKIAQKAGFKHIIFEDNYPANQGNCYSLKKAFMKAGHRLSVSNRKKIPSIESIKQLIKFLVFKMDTPDFDIPPNSEDAEFLKEIIEIYYEFPLVFKSEVTRWGERWTEDKYPTPKPLFNNRPQQDYLSIFYEEAASYT